MTEHDLIKQKIKQYAHTTGFDEIGIARATTLDKEISHYRQWLQNDYHGRMGYMKKNLDKRRDPSLILPGCKSIIVTALSYFLPKLHHTDSFKISRYAWGRDYHEVVVEKLDNLAAFIKEQSPGAVCLAYTDTGPILEKAWAQRAGIGWMGRNGMIINPKLGSWFFIGILLTDILLEPDNLLPNRCGKCHKCMDACPTRALVSDKILDSRKCISYNTIELKHRYPIPEPVSDNMQGYAFGCDICQEVCPWNRKAKRTACNDFIPVNNETGFDPEEISAMTPREFNLKYKSSPILRSKLSGILRNINACSKNQ